MGDNPVGEKVNTSG